MALDPNQKEYLSLDQLRQLKQRLEQISSTLNDPESAVPISLPEIARGLQQGLHSWQQLETQVVNWIYNQSALGFGNITEQRGPWSHWAKAVDSQSLQHIFTDLAQHREITEAGVINPFPISHWLELAITLQKLQTNLVRWFDQQPYDPKAGKRLSIATFLTFTIVWDNFHSDFNN